MRAATSGAKNPLWPPRVLRLMAGPLVSKRSSPCRPSYPCGSGVASRTVAVLLAQPGKLARRVAFSCSLHMIRLLSVFLSVWVWRCRPHSGATRGSCTAVNSPLLIICLPVSCRPALGLLAIVAFSCSLHMMWLLSVFLSVSVWVWRCQPHSWGASLHSREQPLARHLRRSSIPAGAWVS